MNWRGFTGQCEWSQADGWFVQQLANGLWICGPNPAEPSTWTHAELLYVSREDAMQACERRAEAETERAAARVREWRS